MRKYPTNKVVYNNIDEKWSIDLADFSEYKTTNNKGYRFIFVIIDNFSNFTWCVLSKKKQPNSNTRKFK